jgi:anti-sigma factor RsiW
MDCRDARLHLLAYQQGRLDPPLHGDVHAHVETCADCAHEAEAEHTLTDLLERRLPQHPASLALKRRLAAKWSPTPATARPGWWGGWRRALVPAIAVVTLLVIAVPLYYERTGGPRSGGTAVMVAEAVNDHLRLLQSQRPLEIESGGIHQVKPWFAGRLDFAPAVAFAGDEQFPLRGGALGYFLDRKAAVFVYGRRLHTISLFVFRAGGLPWPGRDGVPVGHVRAHVQASRGFNVLLWQAGELGYALVSDVEPGELAELAARVSATN